MDGSLIDQLGGALLHMRRVGAQLTGRMDVSMLELKALGRLADNRPDGERNVFAHDLVEDLHASKAAVSQMLAGLERRGYIERSFNPGNRRKIILTLTAQGRKVVDDAQRWFADMMREVIAEFGEDNARTMVSLVEKLTQIIDRRAEHAV